VELGGRRHRRRQPGLFLAEPVAGQQHRAGQVRQGPGERGLPGPGQPTDQGQPWLAASQVVVGQAELCPGLVGGVPAAVLGVAQARDLRPDPGAVGDVVVAQRHRRRVGGELGVVVEQLLRGVRGPQVFEVHGEERDVVEPVDEAEPIVEVEAVEHPRPVVEAEHVLGEQIAVPVHDPLAAAGEERTATGDEPFREATHVVEDVPG